jgi:phosphoserine phosphatase RsbU/P
VPSGPPTSSSGQIQPLVLVVDDDEGVRDLVVSILRQKGNLRVLEAEDGQEAQEILRKQPTDLVVVDLLMPGLDGLALMQWGREAGLTNGWVILSGRATFDDAVRAVQLGAFDFITKPLRSPEGLLVTVRNAIRQKQLGEERERLSRDVEQRNAQLRSRVAQLEEACRLLSRQQATIDEDLHRAELIQRALLPYTPPPLEGFAVDAIYRPSRDVGGDLYDLVRLDDRHAVLYVADAAGHGVSAAMLAVLFKHRIGMLDAVTQEPAQPRAVLDRANTHIRYECAAPGLFLTAAYCLLDLKTGELTVASAGHPPVIVLRADGRQEMIYHTGPALGLSADALYSQATIRLAAGDRVLLYTDGMYEALDSADRPPHDLLADRLAGMKGDGWEMLHELVDGVLRRAGEKGQEDDVTAVLLSAGQSTSSIDNGQPSRAPLHAPLPPGASVLVGQADHGAVLSVAGRGSWMHSAPFHEACQAMIAEKRALTVDLSLCQHLDSTFLGTLQEIADRADRQNVPLRIQGALPPVRGLFEELGMDNVARHLVADMRPLPSRMLPLTVCGSEEKNRERMLLAHQALAGLNPQNRQEFIHLIDHLQAEVERIRSAPKAPDKPAKE